MTGYTSHHTAEDIERREYDRLHEALSKEQDDTTFLYNNRAVARFLNDEPNPVYGEALTLQVMARAHLVIQDLQDEVPTYASMMTKRVGTAALTTFSLWQGILDPTASTHQDG